MLPFIRSDLAQLTAYTPHGDETHQSVAETDMAVISVDHLDTNESPFDLPEELKQKLAWAYQEEIAANRYPDGGHGSLKRAIAEYVNESASLPDSTFGQRHISVGNGSDELIRSLLIATCLGGSGSVLVAEPTFSMYGILARTLGVPVVAVGRSPLNFEMDLSAAQQAIEQTQTPPIRVVFVVHPNSPTGNPLTAAEVNWLRQLPEAILVVLDEAYFEFSQTTLVAEVQQRPNWMVMRTFSKAFRLAAHRVGYAIAHPELITILEKVRLPYNLPAFSQATALAALHHRQSLLASIPDLLAERQNLLRTLSQHPALEVWPSAANFIYVRLKPDLTNNPDETLEQICANLKAQGTLIRNINQGLRITVGSAEENQRTLARLQMALV